jgi:hypothetical protein
VTRRYGIYKKVDKRRSSVGEARGTVGNVERRDWMIIRSVMVDCSTCSVVGVVGRGYDNH